MHGSDPPIVLEGLNRLAIRSAAKVETACAQCRFSAKEGKDRVCRFEPPRLSMFMIPIMKPPVPGLSSQQGLQFVTQTGFPVVRDDQWCGKFESNG